MLIHYTVLLIVLHENLVLWFRHFLGIFLLSLDLLYKLMSLFKTHTVLIEVLVLAIFIYVTELRILNLKQKCSIKEHNSPKLPKRQRKQWRNKDETIITGADRKSANRNRIYTMCSNARIRWLWYRMLKITFKFCNEKIYFRVCATSEEQSLLEYKTSIGQNLPPFQHIYPKDFAAAVSRLNLS